MTTLQLAQDPGLLVSRRIELIDPIASSYYFGPSYLVLFNIIMFVSRHRTEGRFSLNVTRWKTQSSGLSGIYPSYLLNS